MAHRCNLLVGAVVVIIAALCTLQGAHSAPSYTYSLSLAKAPAAALSIHNAVGQGHSPCKFTFNPAWIEATPGTNNKTGLLVRAAQCPDSYGGTLDHIMMVSCTPDGVCDDLQPTVLPLHVDAEDPRVVYEPSTQLYYLWYYAAGVGERTVYTARTRTPFDASSWESVGEPQPWHRNGCAFPERSDGVRYILFGESPPLPCIGIAKSSDNFESYTMVNDKDFLQPLGANNTEEPEIVVEASTPVVELATGDYLHLYSAGTPGWVAHGNYTAGWIVMDGSDPSKIVQRSQRHVLIASKDYEGVPPLNGYPVNRYRTTFVTSIVPQQGSTVHRADGSITQTYRLWWGAADANVATGLLTVTATPSTV